MAPLAIEGDTLGQKHRNYNKIVNETKQDVIPEINYDESDLDNLFKVDMACKNRNVDYIIKVLQCEDMLYVSRAIKRSTWLITDQQYTHIINPKYLHDQLSPNVMPKAFNKLLLHIRLNLKDVNRVEEFFKYYKERNLQTAFKWLPNCSIQLTVKIIQKYNYEIPDHLLKRLCHKCVTYLDIYTDKHFHIQYVNKGTFIIRNDIDKYLDMVEASRANERPKFGPKGTKLIMKKCRERIMKNIEKYSSSIHVPTFAKFMKKEDIKDFVIKYMNNVNMHSWFEYSKITPLINRLPVESRFEVIKEIFIDKEHGEVRGNHATYNYCDVVFEIFNAQEIYRWYTYAPFNTAFVDLEKVIRSESLSSERASLFKVLLTCAGKDTKNIHALLKYYRENHMNEPLKFKTQFVNRVISCGNSHRFDKETWRYLNDLFSSMDVYNESKKLDQNYARAIILYNVLHDESVPEVIEKKFIFDTFKSIQKNCSEEETVKVFVYLFNYLLPKVDTCKINDKNNFTKTVETLTKMLNLLVVWNKKLEEFPIILDKIKEIIEINENNKWHEDISILYNTKRSWRKLLFEESIVLSPTEETCINALKHGPELLKTYKINVESLCLDDKKQKDRFLKKVRIYWPQTLANTYKDLFLSAFDKRNTHKAAIIGLCVLLPKNDLSNLIQKYVPTETKIDWTQPEDANLSLRKHIALNMHLARPQLLPTIVLLYAKRHYLKFALPSLNAILHNLSDAQTRERLTQLLDSPFSLRKHVIRITFPKLRHDELKKLSYIWESTKSRKIRFVIFNQFLRLLCRENDILVARKLWDVLSAFIDNLTSEDNKTIYTKLSKAKNIPMCVRPKFWMKIYNFFKSLPPEAHCESFLNDLRNNMGDMLYFFNTDFVAEIFFDIFNDKFSAKQKRHNNQIFAFQYVLNGKTKDPPTVRYSKVFVPVLDQTLAILNNSDENFVRYFLNNEVLPFWFPNHVLLKETLNLLIPLFEDVLKRLRENFPIEGNYVFITTRKLSLDCVKIYENILESNEILAATVAESIIERDSDISELQAKAVVELCKLCENYLKEEVSKYFPSIYVQFAKAFKQTCEYFHINLVDIMTGLKVFLEDKDFAIGHLFVLKMLSFYKYHMPREQELKSELLNEIGLHPSKEIKAYCYGMNWII